MTDFDDLRLRIFYAKYRRIHNFRKIEKAILEFEKDQDEHAKEPGPCTRRFCLQLHKEHLVPYDKR